MLNESKKFRGEPQQITRTAGIGGNILCEKRLWTEGDVRRMSRERPDEKQTAIDHKSENG